jgi:hypothetical protein
VQKHLDWIGHPADVPILIAASRANFYFMATLDTRHFLEDPDISRRNGLRIGTSRDVLAWVRVLLIQESH